MANNAIDSTPQIKVHKTSSTIDKSDHHLKPYLVQADMSSSDHRKIDEKSAPRHLQKSDQYCQMIAQHILLMLMEDMGTEYLVQPVARAEDEEEASDFEPDENVEDDEFEDDDDDDEDEDVDDAGKVESPPKRKRSGKEDSDDGGEDDVRPSKR
uniref:Uncharacterized protein n=1 Tax=Daucus carota subsp. sativus TaxID=79200 RepID=A0A175YGT0_DAUCS